MNNQTTWSKIRPRFWNGHFPKTYKWPTGTWKVAYYRNSSQSTMRYHFILVRMAIIKKSKKKKKAKTHVFEDVERRLLSWTIDRNVNWYSHYGKQYRDSSKKNCNYFFIQQLHFQVFIRWKEKHRFQKKLNIPMFIAALFTIGNK